MQLLNQRNGVLEAFTALQAVVIALGKGGIHRLRSKFGRSAASVVTPSATEMSLNDPQWGKKNSGGGKNDGPPDLDEALKKLNEKLGNLFGKAKPKNNNQGPNPPSGSGGPGLGNEAVGGVVLIALFLVGAVWLATGFYQVDEGTRGVELRLGRYNGNTTMPGLRWRLPYPFEKEEIVNVESINVVEVGHRNNQKTKMKDESLMLTQDQNIVDVQFAVQYKLKPILAEVPINSAVQYLFNNKDPNEAVRQAAESAMREVVGNTKMDFVLYEGRADVSARAKKLMQTILDRYETGLIVTDLNLQNAQPPEQVQGAFDDVVNAKQERERNKNLGEAEANNILPRAKGDAARLLEEANGHKQKVVATAKGDAARFSSVVAEYEKAPQVTRERMYLEMMTQVMQSSSKVLVDQKGGQNMLYLPLDKILQMNAQSSPAATAPMPTQTTETITVRPSTSTSTEVPRRDIRNRDTR
jgi:modulator of FtsH protease HflK